MTGSHSHDGSYSAEGESARKIHDDIRRTREEMDSTIDRLGERLDPRSLVDEVLGLFRGSGSSGKSVSATLKEAGRSAGGAIRQHPGPALLLGAGALWWMMDQDEPDHSLHDAGMNFARTSFPKPSWRQEVPAWDQRYDWAAGQESSESWTQRAQRTVSEVLGSAANLSVGERVRSTAARMLALSGHKRKDIHARWSSLKEHSGSFVDARTGEPYDNDYAAGWRHLAACDAVAADYDCDDESYGDKAAECWDSVKSSLSDASLSVQEKIRRATELISEYASQTGRSIQATADSSSESAATWANAAHGKAAEWGDYGRDITSRTRRSVTSGARQAGSQLTQGAETARHAAEEAFNDYPLAVGAACFGLGLLGGLLLPRSRYEDRVLGETADDVKHAVQEAGTEAWQRGERVAAETASAAMEEAERQGLTPEQLGQSARQAAGAVRDAVAQQGSSHTPDAQSVSEKVSSVAEEAGKTAKQEASQQARDMKSTT